MIRAPFSRVVQPPFGPGLSGAVSSVLILDGFSGNNGDNLNGRTPDTTNTPGNTWAVTFASYDIQSNRANTTSAGESLAAIDAGNADVSVSCVVNSGSSTTGRPGILGRYSALNAFWLIYLRVGAADDFTIAERNGGTTIRAVTGVSLDPGTDYTVVGTFNGTTISATVGGANNISYGSASFNQSVTSFGLYNFAANASTSDDFTVTAL